MADISDKKPCPGCGAMFVPEEGAVHAYMTSSPACWAAFGRVLAAEYEDVRLMPVHRMSVDAFAVQHPGDPDDRRAVQSVGLHLARIKVTLEDGLDWQEANAAMQRFAARKAELPRLDPPPSFSLTVADVEPVAGTEGHEDAVRAWVQAAWDDHAAHHDFIRRWTAQ